MVSARSHRFARWSRAGSLVLAVLAVLGVIGVLMGGTYARFVATRRDVVRLQQEVGASALLESAVALVRAEGRAGELSSWEVLALPEGRAGYVLGDRDASGARPGVMFGSSGGARRTLYARVVEHAPTLIGGASPTGPTVLEQPVDISWAGLELPLQRPSAGERQDLLAGALGAATAPRP